MDEVDVTVRTRLHDTESREAVEDAVTNLFPDAEFEEDGDELVARSGTVEGLAELIDGQEINEAARETLLDAVVADTLVFRLSKQPATVGRLNFDVGGHELGALRVRVEAEDIKALVRNMTGGP